MVTLGAMGPIYPPERPLSRSISTLGHNSYTSCPLWVPVWGAKEGLALEDSSRLYGEISKEQLLAR